MTIEVSLAWVDSAGSVRLRTLALPDGATLGQALAAIADPQLACAVLDGELSAAVFGERRNAASALVDGDRIELVAPLLVDPKVARRHRAAQRKAGGSTRSADGGSV